MTASKNSTPPSKQPALVVFGRIKGNAIDQAAYFCEADVAAAKAAANRLGLSAAEIATDAARKVVAGLQEGVVNNQGRFSLSPISRDMLAELQKIFPVAENTVTPITGSTAPADPWSQLKPGALVLAAGFDEDENLEGWYPATIVKKDAGEFVVRWKDFPQEPNSSRGPEFIALLHPAAIQ